MIREIEFEKGKVSIINDTILKIKIKKNHILTLYDAKELFDAVKTIKGDKIYYHVIDIGSDTIFNDEARIFYSCDGRGRLADAIVIKTEKQKVVAEKYLYIEDPIAPTRIFKSCKKAIDWINDLIKTQNN
jgi:hypothetical protein